AIATHVLYRMQNPAGVTKNNSTFPTLTAGSADVIPPAARQPVHPQPFQLNLQAFSLDYRVRISRMKPGKISTSLPTVAPYLPAVAQAWCSLFVPHAVARLPALPCSCPKPRYCT